VKFVTSAGDIVVEVYPDKAPKTAENFLQYVRDKQYDGTVFHRVIDRFMIQGGGMDQQHGRKPPARPWRTRAARPTTRALRNQVGTLAMARTNDPDSATAQFFI
jgi:peptidyl-prolyl cis-trans isomerase A (cyclophilin A)